MSASKQSHTETDDDEEDMDKTRGEIEVLILVIGLLMSPQFYLWSIAVANMQSISRPMWENYLQSQLGSPPYAPKDLMSMYFSPFALLNVLPIDLGLVLYDVCIIVSLVALVLFGFALIEVENREVKRIRILVQEGKACFNITILLLTFFTVVHLLANLIFPFRSLLEPLGDWMIFGIAMLTALALYRIVGSHMRRTIGKLSPKIKRLNSNNRDYTSEEA